MSFGNDFLIRAIARADLENLVDLAAGSGEGPRWSRRDYEQALLTDPPLLRRGLVAQSGKHLAGFAVVSYLPPEAAAEIEGLVVARPCRRCGIGSALVKACMDWAAEAGASSVRLEVRASNAAAIALYRRQGFSPAGVRQSYFSAPQEDALLLETAVEAGRTSIILQGSDLNHGS
jgi:[ribosomal protein S18]-alanine N-acetyltransferase